ncbi:MAG: ribosomal protein S18-alanine N-acetyltransferase [Oscillospiraceae bacterium]|nr:ribosomal protein S18-alanine N-acetyltransferase [Oscillospiraceae bacterium]
MAKEHIASLAQLERECFADPWSEKALEDELSNPNAVFRVALLDGQVAGYVGMLHVLDEGDICNVAVFDSFRRQGVATALIQTLLDYGVEKKLSFITLEVRESNVGAQAFYETMGFRAIGLRKNFYDHPKEHAVLMNRYFDE